MKTSWPEELQTPIGTVVCEIISDKPLVKSANGPAVFTTGGYRIELSRELLPKDWNHGHTQTPALIDGGCCWRWMIARLGPEDVLLTLRCGPQDISNTFWDAATSENLAAIEYRTDDVCLHIGTEDDERLFARTTNAAGIFPGRFGDQLRTSSNFLHDLILLEESGIAIRVPEILVGESIYFHMIAAFKRTADRDDISTWIAVDRSKSELDQAMLRR